MFIHVRGPNGINWNINLPRLHWAGGKFDCLNFPLEIDCSLCLQATGGLRPQEQTHSALWSAHTGVYKQKCMIRVRVDFNPMWNCM